MKEKKISFLIAAHNEEKIIGRTLKNLLELPYKNYEVLVGLDGCTDKTLSIVKEYAKKSSKIKHFNLNLRSGKPAVIDAIIRKASGSIVVINDADWIFTVRNKESMDSFLQVFEDKNIGGIGESFPVEWEKNKIEGNSAGLKMVAYGTYFWFEFLKKRFGRKKGRVVYLSSPQMFLTNIFRRELYKKNLSLGDDFERTKDIEDQGYKVVLFDDISMPRMVATYDKILVKDILKQKIRTAIARRQLADLGKEQGGFRDYYVPTALYILREAWKCGLKVFFYVSSWLFITNLGEIIARFKKQDTKKGWLLRAKR